ncbi:MAG: hypothetical protein MUC50_22925 [Myxococcota bacterium]|jgi:hypothetical protein|nr:hypothetical protein [Myxococcota bacterium]
MKLLPLLAVVAILLCAALALAHDEGLEPIDAQSQALVARFLCDPTEAGLHRFALGFDTPQLISSVYKGDRSMRLSALEAMASALSPGASLPYLVALLEAGDRAVSTRAAHGLLAVMTTCASSQGRCLEMPPAQRGELSARLFRVARNRDLDPDIRVAAWRAMAGLLPKAARATALVTAGLSDSDSAIRRTALSMVDLPAGNKEILAVALRVTDDEDPVMRGQAAALMCENALAHGVSAASQDLAQLLQGALSDRAIPADALAGVLWCVLHFDSSQHAVFAEKIAAHPDARLLALWKELMSH